MIRETDDAALTQCAQRGILNRGAIILVDDPEHVFERSAVGFFRRPTGQCRSYRVQ
jgi:hypothetical protein